MEVEISPVDVLLYDLPSEWDGWPISSRFEAIDFGTTLEEATGADMVEVLIRRAGFEEDKFRVLTGRLSSISDDEDLQVMFMRGDLLDDAHDMGRMYFVMSYGCIRRVLSRVTNDAEV